ncbi:hypothetical protein ACFWJM_16715 [Streptomyces sp. NPDC127077]|uniref:hypothetical protein n=1 Tax=Streptomyces sp. NPDC127077 TaxID=3347131 RepID=UPI003664D659
MGAPRFKSRKDTPQSIRFNDNVFSLKGNGMLHVAKVGDVRVKWFPALPAVSDENPTILFAETPKQPMPSQSQRWSPLRSARRAAATDSAAPDQPLRTSKIVLPALGATCPNCCKQTAGALMEPGDARSVVDCF